MRFFQKVYRLVAQIPPGQVATYGQIAALLGNPRSARAVGWAMRAAPQEQNLPCHRVVRQDGGLAPGFVFGGTAIQRAILAEEGVSFLPNGKIDLSQHLWDCSCLDTDPKKHL
ncbi:MAG: MGMT family protein [Firmicutes bacterium]|nr:MGMT family protein [Bacillota bacterium]